eukprot:scaffold53329_cov63-Attheya_sp.AAC.1
MEEKSNGKVKQTAPTIINPWRHQTIMFADQPDLLRWKVSMDEIREECNRIIAECSDPNNLPANNVQAIRVWLDRVDSIVDAGRPVLPSAIHVWLESANTMVEARVKAMVEAHRPVLPSVLFARHIFVEAITDQ